MKKLRLRKALIVVLGLFLAVGATLSAAQSGEMAVKMAITADMDGGSGDGCDGCPDGDDGTITGCVPACAVNGFAVISVISAQKYLTASNLPWPTHLAMPGMPSCPEPYPPKACEFS